MSTTDDRSNTQEAAFAVVAELAYDPDTDSLSPLANGHRETRDLLLAQRDALLKRVEESERRWHKAHEALWAAGDRHGWCEDYDQILNEAGMASRPEPLDFTVTYRVTVEWTQEVRAFTEEKAREAVEPDRYQASNRLNYYGFGTDGAVSEAEVVSVEQS